MQATCFSELVCTLVVSSVVKSTFRDYTNVMCELTASIRDLTVLETTHPSLLRSQVMFVEHSADDLARGKPCKMGTLQHGRSSWRILRDEETAAYGGSSRRKLYGCLVTLFDEPKDALLGATWKNDSDCRSHEEGLEHKIMSWSQVSSRNFFKPARSCALAIQILSTNLFVISSLY
jgi:hypothetical protein